MSSLFRELCEKWTVTPKLTTAYHPQTNMTERVNRTLKRMIASYVDTNHGKWDQYLPEFRFAINSAVQETTGVTPAELQIGRKLTSPMDKILKGKIFSPDSPTYDVVQHLKQLKADVDENIRKAKLRQQKNYNKNRRILAFKPKQRVWVRNFPQSSAKVKFTAKLAKKWKGPYRVVRQLGPLNYQVVLEDTGQDIRTVHVCNLKAFYPSAEDLEQMERKKILDILQESSDEEDFLGF